MRESEISQRIRLAISKDTNAVIFRNNTANGWAGKSQPAKGGGRFLPDARPLRCGLCKGSSDLIGWTEVEITPEMVGKKVAIFTAIEVKTNTGRVTQEQLNFVQKIKSSGGIAGIAKTPFEAVQLITNQQLIQ